MNVLPRASQCRTTRDAIGPAPGPRRLHPRGGFTSSGRRQQISGFSFRRNSHGVSVQQASNRWRPQQQQLQQQKHEQQMAAGKRKT